MNICPLTGKPHEIWVSIVNSIEHQQCRNCNLHRARPVLVKNKHFSQFGKGRYERIIEDEVREKVL